MHFSLRILVDAFWLFSLRFDFQFEIFKKNTFYSSFSSRFSLWLFAFIRLLLYIYLFSMLFSHQFPNGRWSNNKRNKPIRECLSSFRLYLIWFLFPRFISSVYFALVKFKNVISIVFLLVRSVRCAVKILYTRNSTTALIFPFLFKYSLGDLRCILFFFL